MKRQTIQTITLLFACLFLFTLVAAQTDNFIFTQSIPIVSDLSFSYTAPIYNTVNTLITTPTFSIIQSLQNIFGISQVAVLANETQNTTSEQAQVTTTQEYSSSNTNNQEQNNSTNDETPTNQTNTTSQESPISNTTENQTSTTTNLEVTKFLSLLIDPSQVTLGELFQVSSILAYENDTPISGEEVSYYADDMYLGKNITNQEGVSKIIVNSSEELQEGNYTIKAIFDGTDNLQPTLIESILRVIVATVNGKVVEETANIVDQATVQVIAQIAKSNIQEDQVLQTALKEELSQIQSKGVKFTNINIPNKNETQIYEEALTQKTQVFSVQSVQTPEKKVLQENLVDVELELPSGTLQLEGVNASQLREIFASNNKIYLNSIDIEKATITFQNTGKIEKILTCSDSDWLGEDCSNWVDSGLSFTQNRNNVEFEVTHFSGFTTLDIVAHLNATSTANLTTDNLTATVSGFSPNDSNLSYQWYRNGSLFGGGAGGVGATYNFTTCGALGVNGPSQGSCDTDYSGTSLAGDVTVTSGIQA
ncbi:MAG: hypothetical protein ACI83O_000632, partial [Patescibacteria group bacterium]